MKRVIFTAIIGITATAVFAQTARTDTAKSSTDTTKDKGLNFSLRFDSDRHHRKHGDSSEYKTTYPTFSIGLTFSRFDLGYTKLLDNGSFTLSPQNQFLNYRASKTSTVGFDVFQMSVRFSHTFKMYLSGGFDWVLIRLRDNITILPNQPVLSYRQDSISYSKNRFSSSYLRLPLSFDFRTKENRHGERFHIVFGPEGGFLLDGMVKQISSEHGKQKFNDPYHFSTFRYGGFMRIGYGDIGIFAKYYANDMFENSPQQTGIKNFSFGLMAGF